ncbi:MAG: anti-sigma factor [Thermomicrobiales bacterium]|nr:anti-sigma factor [Thermomicrobiales bacterium]
MALRDHLTIVALLPDFVLGKLDETSQRRVTRHLEACPTCRGELDNALNLLGLLADVPPPPLAVRERILQRVAASDSSSAPRAIPSRRAGRWARAIDAGTLLPPAPDRAREGAPFGQPISRRVLIAASAAVFLATALVGWSYEQQGAMGQEQRISALMSDPRAAYPLDDSDLPITASGVVFAEPTGRDVYLIANGLPALPGNQRYQVWFFTTEDTQVSAGLVSAGADGAVRALLQTPAPFADYVGVGLTAEPESGSAAPTSGMVLGGSFPPISASARIDRAPRSS